MRNTGYEDNSSGVAKLYFDHDDTTGVRFGSRPISEGSGHLYSTSEDLSLWDQALYTDRLLPLESLLAIRRCIKSRCQKAENQRQVEGEC